MHRTPTGPAAASLADPAEVELATEALARALEESAVARDQRGGHAREERELIRGSGLLNLTTPRAFGGWGHPWQLFFQGLRRLAQVDSALAHVYAFHHLQVATVLLYGTPEQHEYFLLPTVNERLFWGNALNPNDKRALAHDDGDGFIVHGPKSYCSGSVGSDQLTFSAWHEASQSLLIAALPSRHPGISIHGDWDAFGQKQTDSGTVTFNQVRVQAHQALVRPGTVPRPRATLRAQIAQLVLVNLYTGIAQGALAQGLRYTRESSRPFLASGVARAVDDPYVQHRYGELSVLVRPAEVLADLAAHKLDQALALGEDVTAPDRGEVAVAVAQAKAVAHRAAIEVSTQVFELTGAGATASRLGLDRFWRNARVHTLHDPLDYKLRDLGRHALLGRYPEPTSYS
ncbi:acyl-CoA dehydrogenase family protein [uncultured Azohydromonas sp.]|uniref:acyl-CoA dehydrogenase family protein n=1 Tax=uncultured Azohydromonas sp. TaxID=487342 RepID=UPI002610EB5D|nr:acyl-CoA dehydrogenase family protein [uncultured Azohydromonas sp.]